MKSKSESLFAIGLVLVFIFLAGCSTPRSPRSASVYLLNTQKSQVELMNEVNAMLIESKYKVKNFSPQTGFLVTEPRSFKVNSSAGGATRATQTVVVRQEGGSVTVRATYECQYPSKEGGTGLQACYKDDVEANAKIRKIEAILLNRIRSKLDGASTSPKEKDLTVESTEAKPPPAPEPKSPPAQ